MGEARSVSQVNLYIKNMFAREYALNNISVRGEVSNCKYHHQGIFILQLKTVHHSFPALCLLQCARI